MEMTVDLEEVRKFVESEKFTSFLLNNTVNFSTAAFVLQTLLTAIETAEKSIDND